MNSKTLQSLTDANASLKVMASPQKMQQYMDRHRIGPLFENLMNKVLHDQPDDPLIYLIKALHKKAGLEMPRDLRPSGVRRGSPERMVRSKSPEMSKKPSQTWGSSTMDVERSYDKPWLSSSKKVKAKSEDFSASKQASPHPSPQKSALRKGGSRPPSLPPRSYKPPFSPDLDKLQEVLHIEQKPITPGRKQPKQPWNVDTKVGKTSFDDLFDEHPEETKVVTKKKEGTTDARQTWGSMGLGEDGEVFTSGVYRGPRTHLSDDDPLAGELMNSKTDDTEETEDTNVVSSGHVRGRRVDAKKHRKELEKLIKESDQKAGDSGYDDGLEEEDDAIELLEDANDLLNEGVTKVPKSGYKLSRLLQQRQEDANIKLNINLYAGAEPAESYVGDVNYKSSKVDDLFDSDEERPATGMSGFRSSPGDSDEEFESVSQVTGPVFEQHTKHIRLLGQIWRVRRPVWNVGEDSDGDIFYPRNSKRSPDLPLSRKSVSISERRNLNQTAPERFEPSPLQSLDSVHGRGVPSKTWNPTTQSMQSVESVRSTSGGWQIPRYDSETEFSEFGDQSARNRPPRAY